MMMRGRPRRSRRSERGQMAGIEAIPFGILVFLAGTLLVSNAWAVVTNRTTAESIAREYLRAYTHAADRPHALIAGARAASLTASAHGLGPDRVGIVEPSVWTRCAVATVTVTINVPEVRAPFLGGFGTQEVEVTHRDRIDAYRAGIPPSGTTDGCD